MPHLPPLLHFGTFFNRRYTHPTAKNFRIGIRSLSEKTFIERIYRKKRRIYSVYYSWKRNEFISPEIELNADVFTAESFNRFFNGIYCLVCLYHINIFARIYKIMHFTATSELFKGIPHFVRNNVFATLNVFLVTLSFHLSVKLSAFCHREGLH